MSHISGEPNSADRFHPLYDAIFRCPSCDFFAAGPSLLEAHLLTHEAVPIEAVGAVSVPDAGVTIHPLMPCKFGCGQSFADRGDLMRHYWVHRRQASAGPGEPEEPETPTPTPIPDEEPEEPAEEVLVARTCRLCDTHVSAHTVGESLRLLREHHKAVHRKPLERLATALLGGER